jgi:hypothetical protein
MRNYDRTLGSNNQPSIGKIWFGWFGLANNQGMVPSGAMAADPDKRAGIRLHLLVQRIQGQKSHERFNRGDTFLGLYVRRARSARDGKVMRAASTDPDSQ